MGVPVKGAQITSCLCLGEGSEHFTRFFGISTCVSSQGKGGGRGKDG